MLRSRSIAFLVLLLGIGPAAAQSISYTNTIPAGSDDGGSWGPILGVPVNGWNRIFRCVSVDQMPDFKAAKDLCGGTGCNPCAMFSFDVPNGPTSQNLDYKFTLTFDGSAFTSSFALVPAGQPIMPADLQDISDATVEFVVGSDKIVVTGSDHAVPAQCPLTTSVPTLGQRNAIVLGFALAAAAIVLILRSRGA